MQLGGDRSLNADDHSPAPVVLLASDLGTSSTTAQLRRLAPAFPRDRFAIQIIVCGPCDTAVTDALRAAGVPVHHTPVRNLFDVSGARKLRQLVASLQPAVLHAWGPCAARLTRVLVKADANTGNTPRVVVSGASDAPGGVTGWLLGRALRRADRVVPASLAEGDRYHRLGVLSERLTRIAPCVSELASPPDGARFRRELGLPPHSRLIFAAGRLESGMPMKSAIWAFDMLRYDAPDHHLVIFGEGPDRALIEDFGRALAFDDFRVHFAGVRPDLPSLLALAEVVLVTQPEGGVNLALEAMSAGRPVVAWHSTELAEVIEDGVTGFLAAPSERAQLAAKTYPLIHEAGLAATIGAAGQARVRDRYGVARAVEQFSRLYGELGG